MLNKIKIIVTTHAIDLEQKVNEFLKHSSLDVLDVTVHKDPQDFIAVIKLVR